MHAVREIIFVFPHCDVGTIFANFREININLYDVFTKYFIKNKTP